MSREELALEREMRRIQQQAERRLVPPLARSLLSGLTSYELFSSAVALEGFPALVEESFGSDVQPEIARELEGAVAEIRNSLSEAQGRQALTDADLVTLVILSAMIADDFDYVDQSNALTHLYQIRRNTALMSRRGDLTKRVNIHFADVRETKGLEFDVVIVPDLGSYELNSSIGRNQAYVAISRAKHALMLGCASDRLRRPEIDVLEQNGLIAIRDVPIQ